MLNCPFCQADLGADSNRLRGGRCPRCGSILSWDQEAPVAPNSVDGDALPMSEVVRTLVERGSRQNQASLSLPSSSGPATAAPQAPAASAAMSRTELIAPPATNSSPPADVGEIWRSAATVAALPSMTLKADSATPDAAISDLLIRPFRVSQPGDPSNAGAEYELQEVIGEGGVGTVYAARQASIDRIVAVKMLREEFAHKRDHRNKFLSEAVVTGELDHPNIVPLYDLGTSDIGSLFYAMKRVRGTPWSAVIRQQSLAENLRVWMSVSDAIAFAHSRGIIHRDLKPENVMLGDFGEVLVMDWGIALSTNMFIKSDRISQSTSMGGTPAYMAPEMATGPLDSIGPASDIYLLGAVLYEVVTGRPPHTGKDVMSCLYAAARNEIQPTDISSELLDVALQAMSTRTADRYSSVQNLQAAIREYQSHSESIVLSTRADEDLAKAKHSSDYQDFARAVFAFQEARCMWLHNERAKSGELEARLHYAATALENGDFDLGLSLLDEHQSEHVALRQRLTTARRERDARQARIKTLRRTAFSMAAVIFLILGGGLVFISRQYQQIDQSNKNLQQTIEDLNVAQVKIENEKKNVENANGELTKAQARLVNSNVALVAAKQTAISEAQTARQEEQNAAAASYRAQIGVAAERIDNNSFRDAERLLDDYQQSQWSFFRHWEWGHLKWLCDRQAAEAVVGPRIESLARSADGRLLVAGTASGQVIAFEVDWQNHALRQIESLKFAGPVTALALSPTADRLAAAGDFDRGTISVVKRQAGKFSLAEKPLPGHPAGVLHLAFSPGGERLLSTSRDGAVRLSDVSTGAVAKSFFGHAGPVWSAAFSPDGSQIVTAGDDTTVRIWRVDDAQPRIYRGHEGPVYAVAFSPQGNWIASAGRDRDIHVWKADKNLRVRYDKIAQELERERRGNSVPEIRTAFHVPEHRLPGHLAEVRDLAFSDDGAILFSGANDNTVRRWQFAADPKSPRFVTVFRGHGGWIRGCVPGHESRYVASGSLDGLIKLWDADKYEEVHTLRGHEDAVYWSAFSPDGQQIVTAGRDRRALLWKKGGHEPILVFDEGEQSSESDGGLAARLKEGHDFLVTSAVFTPDERQIVTSAGDGTVRIWDRQTGGQLQRLKGTGTLGALALSPDGRWLVTGGDGAVAQLWALGDASSPVARLTPLAGDLSAAAFGTALGDYRLRIVTGDVLGNVSLWHFDAVAKTVERERILAGHSQGYAIAAVAFTPDGRTVLSASQDHTVLMHSTATGERLPIVLRHADSVRGMDVSADGLQAVTLSSAGKDKARLSLWNLTTASEQNCVISVSGQTLTSIRLAPDQHSAILTSSGNGKSQVWKWQFGSQNIVPFWPKGELRGTIWSAVFSPNGSHILTVGGSQARLLTTDQGELERTFSPHGPVTGASFSPNGKLIATCSTDGDIKLWGADPTSSQYGRVVLRIVRPHPGKSGAFGLNLVTFAPQTEDDANVLVTAGDDGTARIFKIAGENVEPLFTLTGHQGRVRSAVFSPNGRTVLTAGDDKTARLFDAATGQPTNIAGGVLSHPEMVLFSAFSPDGTLAITGCDDNNAYIWSLAGSDAGKLRFTMQGHTAAVTSAAISPDGRRAVTGSQDGMAKLWDLESGKEILSLKRHSAELTSAHFSPTGDSILTSSLDQTTLIWPTTTIGPSIRYSAARLQIGRTRGPHPIDLNVRAFNPDASPLAGNLLNVRLSPEASSAGSKLLISEAEVSRQGDQIVLLPEKTAVASVLNSETSETDLALRLSEGATAQDIERLLRAMAVSIEQPVDSPIGIEAVLRNAVGQTLCVGKASLQSADAETPQSLAAAAGN